MRYRRRTFIVMSYREVDIGHLQWIGDAMEAWIGSDLVGRYPTRREAASALWAVTAKKRAGQPTIRGKSSMPAMPRLEAPRTIFRSVDPKKTETVYNNSGDVHRFATPSRRPNGSLRAREYLTAAEVERLISGARKGRYGHRDATLILIAYRHGLRASETADLEWAQVELGRAATLHVHRVKNGKPGAHPLRGDEVRALRELRRQFPDSAFVFVTERGGPFTPDAISRHLKRIGDRAGMPNVHAHMLRHGCGYALANAGHDTRAIQDWLGHRSIQHTVRYTELSPPRFRDFWRD